MAPSQRISLRSWRLDGRLGIWRIRRCLQRITRPFRDGLECVDRIYSRGKNLCFFFGKDGTVKSMEPFLTGFIDNNNYLGRPVDVLQMKDGSMLVSDDWNGAVYRITYGKPKTASR